MSVSEKAPGLPQVDEIPPTGGQGTPRRDLRGRAKPTKPGSARPANVHGGSGELKRGGWCTPKWLAEMVGAFDLDSFSNSRSHIAATRSCELERGDNGIASSTPGEYFVVSEGLLTASAETRVWFQPPYSMVLRAFAHYKHTRFVALLRFDPSTEWFQRIYRSAALMCVPRRRRINFEPPPGVRASSSSVPHALYYARAEDATPAVLRACIAWRPR
jgi:hypothetical protein